MGMDQDASNNNSGLQLILGLALTTFTPPEETTISPPSPLNNVDYKPRPTLNHASNNNNYKVEEPSLTLGLFSETYPQQVVKFLKKDTCEDFSTQTTSPHTHSAVSSFSSGRVKRERDVSSEEIEAERRVSDEDEDGTTARKKLRLTKDQSAMLEENFKLHSTLNPKQKQALARQLNLRPRQVEVWFQNRRARTKLKQTEVDCEYLKKCCETLTDENRRLQKEVQELKALKLAQPLYMAMPAATLTMCPSCERLAAGVGVGVGAGAGAGGSNKTPFSMAPKPHFYNPFTNSSAAC